MQGPGRGGGGSGTSKAVQSQKSHPVRTKTGSMVQAYIYSCFFGVYQPVAMSSDVYRYLTCMAETNTRRPFEFGLWWGIPTTTIPLVSLMM